MEEKTIDVSTKIIENKLSLVRRFLVEIVIVVLSTCIVYLFKAQNTGDKALIEYYKNDKNHDQESINRMNGVIENNNVILITIKGLIQEIHEKKLNRDLAKHP